jgi:hypothetical protein
MYKTERKKLKRVDTKRLPKKKPALYKDTITQKNHENFNRAKISEVQLTF